ncbi:MAG TPA: PAS domain-containing protein [Xanthobacteraceae bacterium]|jgi:PAS domain S-box-containing protein|nr:PAS domain-containing protein [Xanthobacteraceae bacterium]
MKDAIQPTQKEVFFDADDIIVSKTDLKGRITYANQVFCHIAGYTQAELLGQPHSILRHPDMPRAVFKLLWDTVLAGREIFAYVKNITKSRDYYWVIAHVTPSYDANHKIIGFHSNRRVPDRSIIKNTIAPLYAEILREEKKHANGKEELAAGYSFVTNFLKSKNTTYDALIFSL